MEPQAGSLPGSARSRDLWRTDRGSAEGNADESGELVQFDPIETVIQLREADPKGPSPG